MEITTSIPAEMFVKGTNTRVNRSTKLTLDGCRFVVEDLVDKIQRRTRKEHY